MNEKEKGRTAEPITPTTKSDINGSISETRTNVKPTTKEVVSAVQELYPKYDRYLHSKVENGALYGIRLRKDAEAVVKKLTKQNVPSKKPERRKLNRSLFFRLGERDYERFRTTMFNLGYTTAQEFLSEIVTSYVNQHEREATE